MNKVSNETLKQGVVGFIGLAIEYFEEHDLLKDHMMTIIAYAAEVILSKGMDDDEFDEVSRSFRRYLGDVHNEVKKLKSITNQNVN